MLLRVARELETINAFALLPRSEGSEGYRMTASNQISLVVDAGTRWPPFTARHQLTAYLKRRLDAFVNPLVNRFWDNQRTPSIMRMSSALAE
jgi:hypothetical protein